MNARELTALAIRILGISFIPRALFQMSNALSSCALLMQHGAQHGSGMPSVLVLAPVFLSGAVYVVASVVLILLAGRIALRLVPGDETEIPLAVDARTLYVLVSATAGVLLIAKGLPAVAQALFYVVAGPAVVRAMTGNQSLPNLLLRTVPQTLPFLIGLFLFFKADILYRFTHAGPGHEEPAEN